MTKEELITHLQDIEWDDFEAKQAQNKVPSNVWETVSAFSNTSGGWIVFGIRQDGKKFEVQGVIDGEHIESDFPKYASWRAEDELQDFPQCAQI